MKSILNEKKSKRTKKSDNIPRFVKNYMTPLKDELPPDTNQKVLVWENSVGDSMGFEVTNGRRVRENKMIDREHGFEPRTKYWMLLEEEE